MSRHIIYGALTMLGIIVGGLILMPIVGWAVAHTLFPLLVWWWRIWLS